MLRDERPAPSFSNIGAKPGLLLLFNGVGIGSLLACIVADHAHQEPGHGVAARADHVRAWVVGISFYLYMPISGMTNPPMQWGYPRTAEGFWHALTRGQYEQPNPTDVLTDPMRFLGPVVDAGRGRRRRVHLGLHVHRPGAVPVLPQDAEAGAGLAHRPVGHVFLPGRADDDPDEPDAGPGLGGADQGLLHLLPHHRGLPDRLRTGPHRRLHGHPLRPVSAFGACAGGAAAVGLALFCLWEAIGHALFRAGQDVSTSPTMPHWIGRAFRQNQDGLPIIANLILVGIAIAFLVGAAGLPARAPRLLVTLGLVRRHAASTRCWPITTTATSATIGSATGSATTCSRPPFKVPDGKPIYPEMTKDAILYRRHRPGPFLPHLHDLLRELHTRTTASPSRTRSSTAAMFTSSPKTPWRTALTSTTSAPITIAARRLIPRSSARSSAFSSATRITKPTCWPGPCSHWTGSSPTWGTAWKSGGAPSLPGSPRKDFTDLAGLEGQAGSRRPAGPAIEVSCMRTSAPPPKSSFEATAADAALRRALAKDLNRLLEHELVHQEADCRPPNGKGGRGPGNCRRQQVRVG